MKKTILTATFLVATAVGLMAQGKVGFSNNPYSFDAGTYLSIENGGAVNTLILTAWPDQANDAGGLNRVGVGDPTWSVQLYAAGVAVGAPIPFIGADWPGVWNSDGDSTLGIRTLPTAGGVSTMLSVGVLNPAGVEVFRGQPFEFTPTTSPTPTPADLLMKNFTGFVVPEPSTIALGVLGIGALLLFRRRK